MPCAARACCDRCARAPEVTLPYVAELNELDPLIPEGRQALPGLFADLFAGLCALPRSVALSLIVAPAPSDHEPEEEQDNQARRVRFTLRLASATPLPTALLARAEALCLSRRSAAESWSGPQAAGPLALPGVAAVMFSLPSGLPAGKRVEGRPLTTAPARTGAVLGMARKAERPPGRLAARLGVAPPPRLPGRRVGLRQEHRRAAAALDDLAAGRMVVLIDPHGDLAATLADAAGSERVSIIDPRRRDTAPLDLLDPDPRRSAAHLASAIAEMWPVEMAGPVCFRMMSVSLRTLAARPGNQAPTLAELERFIVDPVFRAETIASLPAGPLRRQAEHETGAWDAKPSGDSTTVSWLASKISGLTAGPAARLFTRARRAAAGDDASARTAR